MGQLMTISDAPSNVGPPIKLHRDYFFILFPVFSYQVFYNSNFPFSRVAQRKRIHGHPATFSFFFILFSERTVKLIN